jgi:hypothetical protein
VEAPPRQGAAKIRPATAIDHDSCQPLPFGSFCHWGGYESRCRRIGLSSPGRSHHGRNKKTTLFAEGVHETNSWIRGLDIMGGIEVTNYVHPDNGQSNAGRLLYIAIVVSPSRFFIDSDPINAAVPPHHGDTALVFVRSVPCLAFIWPVNRESVRGCTASATASTIRLVRKPLARHCNFRVGWIASVECGSIVLGLHLRLWPDRCVGMWHRYRLVRFRRCPFFCPSAVTNQLLCLSYLFEVSQRAESRALELQVSGGRSGV